MTADLPDWLPTPGAEAPIADGTLIVRRSDDPRAYVLTASEGRCEAALHDGPLPDDAVLVPGPGDVSLPTYADGSALPPLDEQPVFAALPWVPEAMVCGVLTLTDGPFGERGFFYRFVEGRLQEMRLIDDPPPPGVPGVSPGAGMQLTWHAPWDRWCLWRTGELSGEQFLEGATIGGTWPYIALVQGLFEHDDFRSGRSTLPAVPPALALLRLVRWGQDGT